MYAIGRRHPEVRAVEGEDLPRREIEIEVGPLRDDADEPLDVDATLPDVEVADPRLPRSRLDARRQDANRGCLTRAACDSNYGTRPPLVHLSGQRLQGRYHVINQQEPIA